MYNEAMGKTISGFLSSALTSPFFPQHFVGLAGMPREFPTMRLQFADFNMMSSIGAFHLWRVADAMFLVQRDCDDRLRRADVSDEKVWDGAEGLEWTVPTPAPYHTFEEPPLVSKPAGTF